MAMVDALGWDGGGVGGGEGREGVERVEVADAGGDMSYDWLRYVVTRYEPGDGPQNQMVSFMRSMFGDHVLNHTVLKSTAISDAGITKQTLYEVEKGQFTRATYDRAMESINAVNGEIEGLIQTAWGRNGT